MARAAAITLALIGCAGCIAATSAQDRSRNKYSYGGQYVNSHDTPRDNYVQQDFAVCRDQYALWTYVTAIRVCQDNQGIITGMQYFNEHPRKHYDPVTMCLTDVADGPDCPVFKLPIDSQSGKPVTVVNVQVGKVKHEDDYKVVFMSFGFSDGTGIEIGELDMALPGLNIFAWHQEHIPGKMCGLNGFYSDGWVCNKRTGYLNIVKPCYTCGLKPKPKVTKSSYSLKYDNLEDVEAEEVYPYGRRSAFYRGAAAAKAAAAKAAATDVPAADDFEGGNPEGRGEVPDIGTFMETDTMVVGSGGSVMPDIGKLQQRQQQ